eukprot:TRINITY_DN1309_c1_g1_i1.p1 TRINITY_DN1309_c1_g1~~TRINITY_DN1309_c1_g1_i1.p1  ORF type:complete len:1067 (-),score=334.98 TRINITY_DN1309_c1_g1_i1:55-3186(-)
MKIGGTWASFRKGMSKSREELPEGTNNGDPQGTTTSPELKRGQTSPSLSRHGGSRSQKKILDFFGSDVSDSSINNTDLARTPSSGAPSLDEMEQLSGGGEHYTGVFNGKNAKIYVSGVRICFFTSLAREVVALEDVIHFACEKKGKQAELTTSDGTIIFSSSPACFSNIASVWKPFEDKALSLHDAMRKRNGNKIKVLLDPFRSLPVNLKEKDDLGHTPLFAAVKNGDLETLQLLLKYYQDKFIDVNERDEYGWTVLFVACFFSTGKPNEDQIMKSLLKCEQIQVDTCSVDGNTPLHYFCQKYCSPNCIELGDLLIKKANSGTFVNTKNRHGETALHKAIMNQHVLLLMVQLLIDRGADVNIPTTTRGETALHYAVHLKRKDLMKILLYAGADTSARSQARGRTPYELAINSDSAKIAEIIKKIEELKDFLKAEGLDNLIPIFLKEEMDLELMIDLPMESLDATFNRMGITTAGWRIKLKKGLSKLREQQTKEESKKSLAEKLAVAKSTKQTRVLTAQQISELQISLANLYRERKHSNADEDSWRIDEKDLEYTKKLGGGTSGKVYKGIYQGRKVAVKVLKESSSTIEEFKAEFRILSLIKGKHVVEFIGACLSPSICMVMEYCGQGSLYHVMNDPSIPFGWEEFFKFGSEMTEGLLSLHAFEPPIVHRDLKSLNIMLNEDWDTKIIDFGLARLVTSDNLETLGNVRGTVGWTAPELLASKGFTIRSDIYSLIVVFWEMIYRITNGKYQRPYEEYQDLVANYMVLIQASEKNLRPTIPAGCPTPLRQLIQAGWDQNPENRPSTVQILKLLNQFHKKFLENPTSWREGPWESCEISMESQTLATKAQTTLLEAHTNLTEIQQDLSRSAENLPLTRSTSNSSSGSTPTPTPTPTSTSTPTSTPVTAGRPPIAPKRPNPPQPSKRIISQGSPIQVENSTSESRIRQNKALWFFESMDRVTAQDSLKSTGNPSFLIRTSSVPGCYALSKWSPIDGFIHHIVARNNSHRWFIEDAPDSFDYETLEELVLNSQVLRGFTPVGALQAMLN